MGRTSSISITSTPNAPKGGEARFAAIGSFDTFNPSISGQPAAGIGQLFETLLIGSADEPFSEYGLIAESVEIPEDRSSVTFNLRPQAKFHDGTSITADDVLFSFEILEDQRYAALSVLLRQRRQGRNWANGGWGNLPLLPARIANCR